MNQWKIDNSHSEITFKVKHLMITTVTGKFNEFDANMDFDGIDLKNANVNFEAFVNSINTGVEQRDNHLKGDDFFNVEQFPQLTFQSKEISKIKDDEYKMMGLFTMKNITKPITLDLIYNGIITDPWGMTRAGFEIAGKINRYDFDLKWNAATETGGVVVSQDVKLQMNVEMVKE